MSKCFRARKPMNLGFSFEKAKTSCFLFLERLHSSNYISTQMWPCVTFFAGLIFNLGQVIKKLCPVSSLSVLYDTNLRVFCSIDDSYRRIVNCEKPTENDIPNQPQARFTNTRSLRLSCRKEKNWDSEMYLIFVFIKYLFCSGGFLILLQQGSRLSTQFQPMKSNC